MSLIIRPAEAGDIGALTNILNWHIEHDHSAFFRLQPETEEMQLQELALADRDGPHQWLVAVTGGEVIGSAKSKRYREGIVFEQTVETGINLHPNYLNRGIGTILYAELLHRLTTVNVHVAVAGIALPNDGSVALHKKLGFKKVGVFEEYAYLNGRYVSSLWMQKLFNA